MRLFIAEKPSLGRAIADVLPGSRNDHRTHIMVGGDVVTWCFGHLLEQAPPDAYNPAWKAWDHKLLPMYPDRWEVRPRKDDTGGVDAQLNTIERFLAKASICVNAGDPDREGQMLVDEVIEYFKFQKPVQRLLLNSVDEESARKAVASITDNRQFINLYKAALCRARADWVVGLNMTRAATELLSDEGALISIGRVQSPTLALVALRHLAIKNFQPRNFYDLRAKVRTASGTVELTFSPSEDNRIWDEAVAKALVQEMVGKTVPVSVTSKEVSEAPPKLYKLLTLQNDASKRFKWGVKKALDVAQQLYEKKFTSYPRTDKDLLKKEQQAGALGVAESALATGRFESSAKLQPLYATKDSYYKLPEKAEHHALVPTGKTPEPDVMTADMWKIYELVAQRFLLSLMPAYRFMETRIEVVYGERHFTARGEAPINTEQSWRAVEPKKAAKGAEQAKLPNLPDGIAGVVESVEILKGTTTPPKPYTEGTLLEDMGSVAKYVTDERLKQILKENAGIGTPATQAGIIETLKTRQYIVVDGVSGVVDATPFGLSVYDAIPAQLKDPGLTAAWEEALKQIAEGERDSDAFMERIRAFVQARVDDIRKLSGTTKIIGAKQASSMPTKKSSASAQRQTGKQPSARAQRRPGSVSARPAQKDGSKKVAPQQGSEPNGWL